jgi:hypothetical protein
MTISDQELFCDFYLWERIFVDSQINHKFVNPQICERGEIWECSIMQNNSFPKTAVTSTNTTDNELGYGLLSSPVTKLPDLLGGECQHGQSSK